MEQRPHAWLYLLVATFVIVEYARPLFIARLHVQMFAILVLPIAWWNSASRRWSSILTAQMSFLLLCAVAVPFASNNFSAYFTTRTLYGNFAIALSIVWLLAWRREFRRGLTLWLAIMAYVALYSLGHGGRGPGGFLGDENDLALGCLTALPFAFFSFEQRKGPARWASLALGALLVTAIVSSFSRGGFVGLALVAVYCFFTSQHKLRSIGVLVVSLALFLLLAPARYLDEVRSIPDRTEGTAEARLFLWTTAYRMWLDHPILGLGGGNFVFRVGEYQPTGGRWDLPQYSERDWSGTATHSLYLQLLAETGLVGAGIFAFLIWSHFRLLRRLLRRAREPGVPEDLRRDVEIYGRGLAAAMVGYLAAGAFLSVPFYPYPWYLSALAVALETAAQREQMTITEIDGSPPAARERDAALR